jgi:hypothetical protein
MRPVIVPLMGLPLVPITVSWPADTKLFVRGTTATRKRHSAQIDATQPTPAAAAAAAGSELTRARACPLVGRPLQVDPHPGRPERSARAACDIHGMDRRIFQSNGFPIRPGIPAFPGTET